MIEFIKGKITELNPSYAVVDTGSIGYFVNISLNTCSSLKVDTETTLFIHQIIREDAHMLFGFAQKREREFFRLLLTVNGVGANTARVILSSLNSDELQTAILGENVGVLKSVKGIGLKTAQRIIIDLKDKITAVETTGQLIVPQSNAVREEALSALLMLGFAKNVAEKVINSVMKRNKDADLSVEELVKQALKAL